MRPVAKACTCESMNPADRLATKIDGLCIDQIDIKNLAVAADGDDAFPLHSHRAGSRIGIPHGDDLATNQLQVHVSHIPSTRP